MDRFALFVDAGHLIAEGGNLACGTKKRAFLTCDYSGLISRLRDACQAACTVPLLRTYWYDAARDGLPTPDQLLIARLPFTKLRLGRLSGGKQKGVDSLIVRDLMTLARERAISAAFLLSGDEDLREGMIAAQEMGVSVCVLGVPTAASGYHNQADSLIREADQHIVLPTEVFATCISLKVTSAPQVASTPQPIAQTILAAALQPGATPQPVATPLPVAKPTPVAEPGSDSTEASVNPETDSARISASTFALNLATGKPSVASEILRSAPVIPRSVDAALLSSVERALGKSLLDRADLRKDARAAFWAAIRQHLESGRVP